MSVAQNVREKVEQMPLGHPVSVRTFASYGNRAAVDQALRVHLYHVYGVYQRSII